jgi:hypothetical protein
LDEYAGNQAEMLDFLHFGRKIQFFGRFYQAPNP